jgi:catechol 2,3-dioxygenase-like lactoylglutathione lyase family enzyme
MSRTSPMIRAALFVRDLRVSERFYRDLLGLEEVYFQGDISSGNAYRLLGMPEGSQTRVLILKARGPSIGMVGLFEVADPQPPALVRAAAQVNIGEACLVFYCQNLTPVHEHLEQTGGVCLCPPVHLEVGDQIKQREMTLRDPDGVLINLIEWDLARDDTPELDPGRLR